MTVTSEGFDRVTADAALQDGNPCVRGMRLTVQRVLEVLATNPSWADLRADYPEIEDEDIDQVLAFTAAGRGDRP
jgi:uncharacterized protein (DUF433 family)